MRCGWALLTLALAVLLCAVWATIRSSAEREIEAMRQFDMLEEKKSSRRKNKKTRGGQRDAGNRSA